MPHPNKYTPNKKKSLKSSRKDIPTVNMCEDKNADISGDNTNSFTQIMDKLQTRPNGCRCCVC